MVTGAATPTALVHRNGRALFMPALCRHRLAKIIAAHREWECAMANAPGISNLTAAQLSQATYDTYEPDNLPAGWADDFQYYYNNGTNSFSTFVNAATHQVVIAFEGTQS